MHVTPACQLQVWWARGLSLSRDCENTRGQQSKQSHFSLPSLGTRFYQKKKCRPGEHLQPKTFNVRLKTTSTTRASASVSRHASSQDEGAGVRRGAPRVVGSGRWHDQVIQSQPEEHATVLINGWSTSNSLVLHGARRSVLLSPRTTTFSYMSRSVFRHWMG